MESNRVKVVMGRIMPVFRQLGGKMTQESVDARKYQWAFYMPVLEKPAPGSGRR